MDCRLARQGLLLAAVLASFIFISMAEDSGAKAVDKTTAATDAKPTKAGGASDMTTADASDAHTIVSSALFILITSVLGLFF